MKNIIYGPSACLLLAIVIMVTASSCKKDIPGLQNVISDNAYYIRFKENGIQKEYKYNIFGQFNKRIDTSSYGNMAGATGNQFETKMDNIGIVLITNQQTKTSSSYTNSITDSTTVQILSISYFDENGVSYVAPIQTIPSFLPASTVYDNLLTFTEVSDAYVKGVFSGTVYNNDYSKKVVISEGIFYLKRYN